MGFSPNVIGDDRGFNIKAVAAVVPPPNFDFTTGVLPPAITFTRPSIGTYFNNAGILTTASNDVARFNYVGGVSCLLIEPGATNLLTQSNNFSVTWSQNNGVVVTAAQFISPDGTNNGWTMTSGTGSGQVLEVGTLSNIPYAISIWAKQIGAGGGFQLYINGQNANVTITTTLQRVSSILTPPAGSSVVIGMFTLPYPSGYTAGIYGAQVEAGSTPTSYIPTTTAAVTRAADSAVFTIPAGIGHLTYTFDDNSTQLVTASAGSYTIPTNLNRPNIKSIVGSA